MVCKAPTRSVKCKIIKKDVRIFLLILGVLSILCCTCLDASVHTCVYLCTFMYRYHDIFVFILSFVWLVSSSAVQIIYFEIYVSVCSSLLLPVYTILSSMCPHVFLGLCSPYVSKTLVPSGKMQVSGA